MLTTLENPGLFISLEHVKYLVELDSVTIEHICDFPNIALMFLLNVLYTDKNMDL